MSAKSPFQSRFSAKPDRKRKRDKPQDSTLSLNPGSASLSPDSALNNPNPKVYPIVDGILSLAVFSTADDYQLQLVDKDNNYIEDTLFFINKKDVVQNISDLTKKKDFSGLIRYLQNNSSGPSVNNVIREIQMAAKSLLLANVSIPISGPLFRAPSADRPISALIPMLPSLSIPKESARAGEEERLKVQDAVNKAEFIYSGRSGSPVYGDLRLSVSTIKQDQPEDGAALNPFTK